MRGRTFTSIVGVNQNAILRLRNGVFLTELVPARAAIADDLWRALS